MSSSFKALVVSHEDGKFSSSIVERRIEDLPEGDLLIKVKFSSLNYKDAMSATGMPGVTREYPHTPGIDATGEVVQSSSSDFKEGEKVIVKGCGHIPLTEDLYIAITKKLQNAVSSLMFGEACSAVPVFKKK